MKRFQNDVLNLVLAAGVALAPGLAAQTGSGTAAQPQAPAQGQTQQGQPQTQGQPMPPTPPSQGQPAPGTPGTQPAPPTSPTTVPGAAVPAPATGTPGGTGQAAFGFSLTAPQGWTQATDTSTITVPGEVCCAWSPDGTSTLVVFRQKPKAPVNPRALLNQSVKAYQTSLGATINEQDVRDIGGMRAMWMIVTGKGNGAAIDGKGTVATSQHWVAIPRTNDILIFLLTAPQDKFATYEGALQQALSGMQVSGAQTPNQKAAK